MIYKISDWIYTWSVEIFAVCSMICTVLAVITVITYLYRSS